MVEELFRMFLCRFFVFYCYIYIYIYVYIYICRGFKGFAGFWVWASRLYGFGLVTLLPALRSVPTLQGFHPKLGTESSETSRAEDAVAYLKIPQP